MKLLSALAFFILASSTFAAIETTWEKVEEKQGVEVFRGDVKGLPIVAFRGASEIEAPLFKVLSVIYDTSRIKEWMSDINDTRVIERISKLEKIEYNRTDAPWPLSDRDFVYRAKGSVNEKDKTIEIAIESLEDPRVPKVKDAVRGHLYSSRYFVRYLGPDKTYLEVEMLADPKGALPKWVVNMFQATWPVNTINGIRRLSIDPNYGVHPDLLEEQRKFEKKTNHSEKKDQ
jgi:hypothetical protein